MDDKKAKILTDLAYFWKRPEYDRDHGMSYFDLDQYENPLATTQNWNLNTHL